MSDLSEVLSATLMQLGGVPLEGGHRFELLENGRIFNALEEAIGRAQKTVHFTVFMWMPGEAAERMVRALTAAAARGVHCRIALDAIGSTGYAAGMSRLKEAGCEVRIFRMPLKVSPRKALERTHRKIVVIDGAVAFTGGFGVRDVWLGEGESPEHWRDTHLRVEGPAVQSMQAAFAEVWLGAGGDLLGPDAFPAVT